MSDTKNKPPVQTEADKAGRRQRDPKLRKQRVARRFLSGSSPSIGHAMRAENLKLSTSLSPARNGYGERELVRVDIAAGNLSPIEMRDRGLMTLAQLSEDESQPGTVRTAAANALVQRLTDSGLLVQREEGFRPCKNSTLIRIERSAVHAYVVGLRHARQDPGRLAERLDRGEGRLVRLDDRLDVVKRDERAAIAPPWRPWLIDAESQG